MTAADFTDHALPYVGSFLGAFALTLALTPVVRELHRRFGLVDKPDPRRINKVPIPRGGGVALVVGVLVSYYVFHALTGLPLLQGLTETQFHRMTALGLAIALLGLADDRFSLRPVVKLAGQVAVAFFAWFWADLGFNDIWPSLPAWADCAITVFWFVGAINAFNLIDGLDGLASGIALIATLGMAGSLVLAQSPVSTLFYLAFAGGLLGFLRYNYNPASVFLGDSGSMFIGFTLAVLPFASHAPNSFLVSVGVPLLAMGVPIFDTFLAILRRMVRRVLGAGSGGSRAVMTADTDHLHHRMLRAAGMNQRRAAWALYALALGCVGVGLAGAWLESRAAALWLAALAVGAVIVVRDMARVELFDMGRLLGRVAHDRSTAHRRVFARLRVPTYLVADTLILVGAFACCCWLLKLQTSRAYVRTPGLVRVVATFAVLVAFRAYATVWSRAVISNYVRLAIACLFGSIAGSVILVAAVGRRPEKFLVFTVLYAVFAFLGILAFRLARPIIRDLFYAIDCSRLKTRKDVSRILVYGAGLRFSAFRRELVRTTAANERMIVGLIDDDLLLKGHYIGGLRVCGTLADAPDVINEMNADAVVIACDLTPERMEIVRQTLAPTGVKVSLFTFGERPIEECATGEEIDERVDDQIGPGQAEDSARD